MEAQLSRARRKSGLLVFQGALSVRIISALGIVGFSILLFFSAGHEETWLLILGTCLVLGFCFAWPVSISLGPDGLRRHIWWRKAVFITWNEVTGIQKNKGGDIEVFGKLGQSISFTRFHIDPLRFETEVKKRAGLDRTLDPSLPPSIR
jgi:hypothetical protein